MYKAALFDLDGTLMDSVESLAYCCNKGLEACGLAPHKPEHYQYFAGDGPQVLVRKALEAAGDKEGKFYDKVLKIYNDTLIEYGTYKVKAYEGLKEALDVMKQAGTKLAVVTNKPHDRAIEVVEAVYGKGYFDSIIGFCEERPRKPDPAGALCAIKELGVRREECIYVGDTDVDMQTGNAAGVFTVGVLWGFRDRAELERHHAQAIVEVPAELLSIWEK